MALPEKGPECGRSKSSPNPVMPFTQGL